MESEAKSEFSSYSPDELRELYRENPDLFEKLAAEAIDKACIGSTPEQSLKLRQMQWLIDAKLRKGKTPLQRMHIMEDIFYGQVYGREGHVARLLSCWQKLLGAIDAAGKLPGGQIKIRLLKE